MFDRLGDIMYAMGDNENTTTHLIKQFIEEFKEEKTFINYFLKTWCHDETRIGKFVGTFNFFCIFLFTRFNLLFLVNNIFLCFLV